MLVSIIIINYNTFDLTCQCIASVIKYTQGVSFEIIVVDNDSPTDNPDMFLEKFPGIKLIKSTENTGFAKGNNIGMAQAQGDVILLFNSDAYLIEDSISVAAKFIEENKKIGVASVKLLYEDRKFQHTARAFRSIRNELLDIVRPVLYLLPYRKRAQLMLNQYFKGDFDTECDWVSGAFFMFRKELLHKLPREKLDERFFMYGEDQLWCFQFQNAGYRNYFLAGTKAVHIANASTAPAKQMKLLKTMLNLELEIMKYRKGSGLYYFVFKWIFQVKEISKCYIKWAAYEVFKFRIR